MPDLLARVGSTRTAVLTVRDREEQRAIAGVPWRPWDNPYQRFDTGGPLHPSRAVQGLDSMLQLSPVYGAARIIADGVASVPLYQYVNAPAGPLRWNGPSWLDKPSVVGSLFDWLWQGTCSAVLQGNALALITGRDGYGYPTGAEWLPWEACNVIDPVDEIYNPLRARFYYMGRQLPREDLIHLKAFAVPGRTEGISPMRAFATLISSGNAAVNYGAQWFEKGGFPPGVFQNHELEVGRDEAREIRRMLVRTIQAGEPLVYGRDWEYKPVSVPPSEAQFIEHLQMNATQIAAVYGIPPERIGGARGDSLTYSTQEQETLSLITDTLRPWFVRWESLLNPLTPASRYVKFYADAMIRTDARTRHDIYKLRRDMGMETVDQIRAHEDMGPLGDAGDGKETLPLEVLVAMARGMKAIPKSMESLVDLSETTVPPGAAVPTATMGDRKTPPPAASDQGSTADGTPAAGGSTGPGTNPGGDAGASGSATEAASADDPRFARVTAARLALTRYRAAHPGDLVAATNGHHANGNGRKPGGQEGTPRDG